MKSPFRDRLREIWNVVSYVGFLLGVVALFVWLVYSGEWNPLRWLREVFSILWFVAASMSLLALVVAHDSRKKQDWESGYRRLLLSTGCALASIHAGRCSMALRTSVAVNGPNQSLEPTAGRCAASKK